MPVGYWRVRGKSLARCWLFLRCLNKPLIGLGLEVNAGVSCRWLAPRGFGRNRGRNCGHREGKNILHVNSLEQRFDFLRASLAHCGLG